MTEKQTRLGRGLSSLIDHSVPISIEQPPIEARRHAALASSTDQSVHHASSQQTQQLVRIGIGVIGPNKYQPRRSFDSSTLLQLADSIKQAGVMQPIVVRPDRTDRARYEIIAGERRWRVAALAGLSAVPAIVHDIDDEQSAEWALVENIQREDLNAIDRAGGPIQGGMVDP